ncbi:hypothetical protein [Hypsugopox virus]|nr:hypothetical protein [Hypsugopox virus]
MIITSSKLYYYFYNIEKQYPGFVEYFLHMSKLCTICTKKKCCICKPNNKFIKNNVACIIKHILTCYISNDEAFYILHNYLMTLLPTSLLNITIMYFLRIIQYYVWCDRTTLYVPIQKKNLSNIWNKGYIFHSIIGTLLPNNDNKKKLFTYIQQDFNPCYICKINNYYTKHKNINIYYNNYINFISLPNFFMKKIKHLFCLHASTKTFLCSELQDSFICKNVITKNKLYSLKDLCCIVLSNYIKNIVNQLYYSL